MRSCIRCTRPLALSRASLAENTDPAAPYPTVGLAPLCNCEFEHTIYISGSGGGWVPHASGERVADSLGCWPQCAHVATSVLQAGVAPFLLLRLFHPFFLIGADGIECWQILQQGIMRPETRLQPSDLELDALPLRHSPL